MTGDGEKSRNVNMVIQQINIAGFIIEWNHRYGNAFNVFYSCHVFYAFNIFFIFPAFFKIKNAI